MSDVDKDLFLRTIPRIMSVLPAPGVLLLCGSRDTQENLITIGWLQFGVLWNEPTVNIFIRKSRHSYKLLQESPEFTLNVSSAPAFQQALHICATTSGSYCDKFKEAQLTKVRSKLVTTSSLQEAEIVLECKTVFTHDFNEDQLSDIVLNKFYNQGDYHQMITGKIVHIKEK